MHNNPLSYARKGSSADLGLGGGGGDTDQDTMSPDYATFFVCTDEAQGGAALAALVGLRSKASDCRAYKAYPRESPSLHVARPWVAFDRTAAEVASGGIGFGRDAIRRDCQPFLAAYLASQRQRKTSAYDPSVAVFGGVLASLAKRPDTRNGVPAVVRLLCARLLKGDCAELREMGIFRVPGDAAEVATVAAAINRGGDVAEIVAACSSAHTVAALLKKFFRELSAPLCSFELYSELLHLAAEMGEMEEMQPGSMHASVLLETLRATLARLPEDQRTMLGRLLAFLSLVVALGENRMGVRAQAAVWGPNLLRPQVETADLPEDIHDARCELEDIVHVVNMTATMIRHVDELFDSPVPLGREGLASATVSKFEAPLKKTRSHTSVTGESASGKAPAALKWEALALKWRLEIKRGRPGSTNQVDDFGGLQPRGLHEGWVHASAPRPQPSRSRWAEIKEGAPPYTPLKE